jgi:hypothetical protein
MNEHLMFAGASTAYIQGTYQIVKGVAGEVMFWVSFVTVLILLGRAGIKVVKWLKAQWAERGE